VRLDIGKYACFADPKILVDMFHTQGEHPNLRRSWSIEPGREAFVVGYSKPEKLRHLAGLRWGMELAGRNRSAQATVRVEDVDESDALTKIARTQRCLVPVDAFYLRHRLPSGWQPFAAGRRYARPTMAVAGLWDVVPQGGSKRRGFAILTIPASPVIKVLQDRMPIVLDEADWPLWLGEVAGDPRSVVERQTGNGLYVWPVRRTRPNLHARQAQQIEAEREKLRQAGSFKKPSTPRRIEFAPEEYDIEEVLLQDYTPLQVGDPFICCDLAARAVAWSRTRLAALQQQSVGTAVGQSNAQQQAAFRRTMEVLSACLTDIEHLLDRLGAHHVPPATLDSSPVDDCFGEAQTVTRLGHELSRLGRIVLVWPDYFRANLAWPDPDTAPTGLLASATKHNSGPYADLAGETASYRSFRPILNANDLFDVQRFAENFVRLAEVVVSGLEASAGMLV
jgi:putative SOS response-associated peptidase YedK